MDGRPVRHVNKTLTYGTPSGPASYFETAGNTSMHMRLLN